MTSISAVRARAEPHAAGAPARLGAWRLTAFGALAMPVVAAQVPLNVFLPAIFASQFGITLSTLGLVFLIEKVWGAAADPLMGVLSDRTRSRFGRRRIWMAAGAVVFALSTVLLFFPPARVGPLYIGVGLFAFYLSWSMIWIPYYALSAEISGDYDERTRIATYQSVTGAAALLLVMVMPAIVEQVAPNDGRLKLAVIGGFLLALIALTLPPTLLAVKEPPPPAQATTRHGFWTSLRLVFGNPLLLRVLAADFSVTLGQLIRGALFVFFVTAYMGLPRWISILFMIQYVCGLVAGPIWMRVSLRLGKHRTAIAAELAQVAINLGLLFVGRGGAPLLLVLTLAQGLAQGSGNLMLRAMVADVVDEDRLRTGEDRTALFFSVFSISTKAAMAVAVGVALPLVGWLGFDPKAAVNTPAALNGLLAVFALGPALFHLIAAGLLVGYPLDAGRHAEIRRALAERDAEAVAGV
jgi:Na+/melibiose symporter-like transporter